jgi:hypothetical protein
LVFRLSDAGGPLAVDRLEQLRYPNRYEGTEYLSSQALKLDRCPDGALIAVAPAPCRYRVSATRGTLHVDTVVLIRPEQVRSRARLHVSASGPLDRGYVARAFDLARRVGFSYKLR